MPPGACRRYLALTTVPYLGSADEAVLGAMATRLGAVALMAAVTASRTASRHCRRVVAAAPAAVLVARYDTSRVETAPDHRAHRHAPSKLRDQTSDDAAPNWLCALAITAVPIVLNYSNGS